MAPDQTSPAAPPGGGPGTGPPPPGRVTGAGSPPPSERAGAVSLPSISLPTGGGAIRGIGETFTANPATGTGSMSVPIATSPGRSGFGPQLALSYDSGRGNGELGFGWSLSLPSVTRRTDRGMPRYDDAGESDVYLLSEAEDLVPVREESGSPPGFRVDRYRPRVEGLFARIERWTRLADGDVHWRSVTRDNVTAWYGEDAGSRVADPADPRRVFRWLVSRSFDPFGNAMVYEYAAEDGIGVDTGQAHERHRTEVDRSANRYLKRIRYGNQVSRLTDPELSDPGWLFEVVFDYGDHDEQVPVPVPDRPWPVRSDPFSSYRSGFEVRTYRLCRRVLMFHHFPDEPGVGADCLVRSTAFTYQPGGAVGEMLTSVTQRGHRREGDGYLTRSLPPVELGYSPATLHDEVREVDVVSLAGAPAGLAGEGYQWVDLDGEGISGILAEQGGGWYYQPNRGDGRFGPATVVSPVPTVVGAGDTTVQLLDLAGDGRRDAAVVAGPTPGFFARREHGAGWEPFVAFDTLPTVDWDDPRLRMVDLDGDGHADVLLTEDDAVTWYPSRGERGFAEARRVSAPPDEERGPRLVHADAAGAVHLADMSGDGLADLVRIRNGEVCYWPNLGYGRFGAKVTMDDPPWFDHPERFDPRFLRLADVDGSGVTDIVYLGHDGARIHLNRSGNGWAPPHLVATAPRTDNRTHVATVDLFGTGTTCLVWSSDRPEDSRRSLRYIDLLDSTHPHLLVTMVNNLGAETHVGYAPSTRFYLADRAAGWPWLTRLPFPVQVVERVTTLDRISRNRFVTRYAYHHGHFDGLEREFRGFGMVEQWDTEELSTLGAEVDLDASNEDPASHVPPVLTKTWFHTGTFAGRGQRMSRQFEAEYWREPGLTDEERRALLLADTHPPEVQRLPDGTAVPHQPTAEEIREACRALKGRVLRQEVYAIDGSEAADRPYQVTERNYSVEVVQQRLPGDLHAVLAAYPRETVTYHYDRRLYPVDHPEGTVWLADPRVSHEATLEVDGYGNLVRVVTVGYGRRHPDADLDPGLPGWAREAVRAEQTRLRATLTVNGYTNRTDAGPDHRAPLPCESRSYELVNLPAPGPAPARFSLTRLRELADAASDGAHDLPYQDVDATGASGSGPWRRLVEHVRTLFRRDDQTGPLPLGQAQSLGLPHEHYQLALTPDLVGQVFRRTRDGVAEELLPDPAGVLVAEGGYVAADAGWWVPSGQLSYAPDRFFQPTGLRDPFGNLTTVGYDPFSLLVRESRDPLDNRVTAELDYRVLQPRLVTDPNRNRTAVAFDALGLVVGTAGMGKPEEEVGDSLAGFPADLADQALASYLADPLADPHAMLGTATSRTVYDLFAYHRTRAEARPQPMVVGSIVRETHRSELTPGEQTAIRSTFSYSDGFGREIQRKLPAEPDADGAPRWVGSGWTVFDNKGNRVRQFEPFFTGTHRFENEQLAGVSPVEGYDPTGRLVATLNPDGSYAKLVFDPWRQLAWDGNDTVLLDPRTDPDVRRFLAAYLATQPGWQTWHARRQGGGLGEPERAAAEHAAGHAGTPAVTYLDSLGRPVLAVAHNRSPAEDGGEPVEQLLATWTVLDIEANRRSVVDPAGRMVLRHDYDLLGSCLRQATMDAGQRWTLGDVQRNPLYQWDLRGHRVRTSYDPLRRPVGVHLQRPDEPETQVGRTEYGESHPDAQARNLRGEVHQVFDATGVVTTDRYDFKGNQLEWSRRLVADYRSDPDWSADVPQEALAYRTRTSYDALDRPVAVTTPDGTVTRYRYNEANLLEEVTASVRGEEPATRFVTGTEYAASGQRTRVVHGNGVRTSYAYDPQTFRLVRLRTERGPAGSAEVLQDLSYTYDSAGNLTHVRDQAQQPVFFRNQRVDADAGYVYDATYQLVAATGREHLGQGSAPVPAGPDDTGRVGLPHPGDGNAVGRYRQRYTYDGAGNLLATIHVGSDPAQPGWTRQHHYQEPSGLEPGRTGNRLTRTEVGGASEPYAHDPHGNLAALPHLPLLRWDHRDQLRASSRQVVEAGTPEITWYGYDPDGQRVRLVTDRQAAATAQPARRAERIYLDGFEIYREYGGDGTTVTLERETVHVLAGQQRVALVETRTRGDDGSPDQLVRYQCADRLGSASLELDGTGAVISYEEYTPYGATAYQAVRSGTEAPKRYRYAGKERDEPTGLCYYGARYYAPWLARWLSPDPAGLLAGPRPAPPTGPPDAGAAAAGAEDGAGARPGAEEGRAEPGEAGDEPTPSARPNAPPSRLELQVYCFVLNNPVGNEDPDGAAPEVVGRIYVVEGTWAGKPFKYVGSTAQGLRTRFSGHRWQVRFAMPTTKVTIYQVTADLNVAASARGTIRSAVNEALRAPEQRKLDRAQRGAKPGEVLNKRRAATPENVKKWTQRHKVTVGRGRVAKAVGGGLKLRAAGGALILWDAINMARELDRGRYVMAPYELWDEYGEFTISERRGPLNGLWGNKYYKNYFSGERKGQKVEVSEQEFRELKETAEFLYGRLDFWNNFIPGLLRKELPVINGIEA